MKKTIANISVCVLLVAFFINSAPHDTYAYALAPSLSSNVIFIPGIETTRLYSKNIFSYPDQLWEPNDNLDVPDLYLNTDGTSLKNVYAGDIIGKTNLCTVGSIIQCPFDQNIYNNFEASLDTLKTNGTIADWKAFPYDWRLDMNTTIDSGVEQSDGTFKKITDVLTSEAASSHTGKVTIITHSNGGLFLKLLLVKLQQQKDAGQNDLIDDIDKVIMVAAPQYGTPLSVAGLLHGDDQELGEGFLLSNSVARNLGENMPTAYGLMPSQAYFDLNIAPVVTFDPSISNLNDKFNLYGSSITDRSTLDAFVTALRDGRSKPSSSDDVDPDVLDENLVAESEMLHSTIDNYTFPSSMKVYAIAGVGVPTVDGITYFAKQECLFGSVGCSYSLDRNLTNTAYGDNTVIAQSAIGTIPNHYYLNLDSLSSDSGTQYSHENIMEAEPIEDFISNILTNRDTIVPSYISTTMPDLGLLAMFNFSTHSPVSLDVYDSSGKHIGISSYTSTTSPFTFIDQGILNSSFYQIGDERYISVPAGTQYTVKVKGLDAGSFTLNVDKTVGNQLVASTSFNDIPVSPGEQATLTVNPDASTSALGIDTDGDGKVDIQIQPGNSLDPASYLELLRDTILNLSLKTRLQDELFIKIERLVLLIKQDKIKQAKNAITEFSRHLGLTKKWYKGLTGDNRDVIVTSISNFLDQFFPQ